jgi:Tol biopolymer transport system component
VLGSSVNTPRKLRRSMSAIPMVAVAALIAIAACDAATAPSSTSGLGPTPSAVARSPEATRHSGPLILFTRTTSGDNLQTFTIGIDGSQQTELSDARDCCGFWSPDGTTIVVPDKLAASRLLPATLKPDGTGYTVYSIGPPTLNLPPAGWSPDGTQLLFEAWDDTRPDRTGVYVSEGLPLATAAPVQITHAPVHDIPLQWSPDGTRILLIRVTPCPEGDCEGGDLYVVDADGSDLTRLSPKGTFVACCGPAGWSPDASQVPASIVRERPTSPGPPCTWPRRTAREWRQSPSRARSRTLPVGPRMAIGSSSARRAVLSA